MIINFTIGDKSDNSRSDKSDNVAYTWQKWYNMLIFVDIGNNLHDKSEKNEKKDDKSDIFPSKFSAEWSIIESMSDIPRWNDVWRIFNTTIYLE